LGREYGEAFNAVFPQLARRHGVAFYPFILDGVAGRADLNQDDGIHPNRPGVTIMVDRIVPHVVRLLQTLE
jgi:acyl-CoA thioesterase-1